MTTTPSEFDDRGAGDLLDDADNLLDLFGDAALAQSQAGPKGCAPLSSEGVYVLVRVIRDLLGRARCQYERRDSRMEVAS